MDSYNEHDNYIPDITKLIQKLKRIYSELTPTKTENTTQQVLVKRRRNKKESNAAKSVTTHTNLKTMNNLLTLGIHRQFIFH